MYKCSCSEILDYKFLYGMDSLPQTDIQTISLFTPQGNLKALMKPNTLIIAYDRFLLGNTLKHFFPGKMLLSALTLQCFMQTELRSSQTPNSHICSATLHNGYPSPFSPSFMASSPPFIWVPQSLGFGTAGSRWCARPLRVALRVAGRAQNSIYIIWPLNFSPLSGG